jgi:AcrR family transcriptional regulator
MKATPPAVRQRLFDEAVRLFARRGYEAVGIREIATAAAANVAAVNYYYGGKSGLLKAVIERFVELYWQAVTPPPPELESLARHVRFTVRALVTLYREHLELALAADSVMTVRVPEVNTLQARLLARHRYVNNGWFARLGIDLSDVASAAVMRGMLTNLIEAHFRQRFANEEIIGPPTGLSRAEKAELPELSVRYDDAFYERYSEKLASFYMSGVEALRGRTPARRQPARPKRGGR